MHRISFFGRAKRWDWQDNYRGISSVRWSLILISGAACLAYAESVWVRMSVVAISLYNLFLLKHIKMVWSGILIAITDFAMSFCLIFVITGNVSWAVYLALPYTYISAMAHIGVMGVVSVFVSSIIYGFATVSDIVGDLGDSVEWDAGSVLIVFIPTYLFTPDLLIAVITSYRGWEDAESKREAKQSLKSLLRDDGITSREYDVLRLLADEGLPYRAIASQLCVSDSTIKSHVRHLGKKLNATGRSGIVASARKKNLLPDSVQPGLDPTSTIDVSE